MCSENLYNKPGTLVPGSKSKENGVRKQKQRKWCQEAEK